MIELPEIRSAELAHPPGGGKHEIISVVTLIFHIIMVMPDEYRMPTVSQQLLHILPVPGIIVKPQGLMHEYQGPFHIRVPIEHFAYIIELRFFNPSQSGSLPGFLRIQAKEKDIFIDEVVIGRSEFLRPDLRHDIIGIIVVAGDIEERHLKAVNETIEFIPFPVDPFPVLGISLDQVADAYHEFRLKKVELADGILENPGSVSAGTIRNNGKLKIPGRIVHLQVVPGVSSARGIRDNTIGSFPGRVMVNLRKKTRKAN
jgi:hypothetical protein